MRVRPALVLGLAIAGCSLASAQQRPKPLSPAPLLGPLRDAGIYHLATGSWIRGTGSSANLGPDTMYSATAPSGYFGSGWEGAEGVDEIRLPGTDAPTPGLSDAYVVDGFTFSYCSDSTEPVDWSFFFYDAYTPCGDPTDPIRLVSSVSLAGLPSAGACWTLTIDLGERGSFVMLAENSAFPGYDGAGLQLDHGGIGWLWSTADGGLTGPVLAGGDADWATSGANTCYDPTPGQCAAGANGLGHQDLFTIGVPLSGCFFFGGYKNTNGCGGPAQGPPAQFYFELHGDCDELGCLTATCCPDNLYCTPNQGSPNNTSLISIDACSIDQNPAIRLYQAPPGFAAYLLVGDGSTVVVSPPGAKGDLCVAGGSCLGRYVDDLGVIDSAGELETDLVNGATGGGSGDLPSPCSGSLMAGQTWSFQYWHRQPMMQESTFSEAMTTTFN